MNLTEGLAEHLQAVAPPPPDLDRVVTRGRGLRRRRRAAAAGALAVVLSVAGAGGATLLGSHGDADVTVPPVVSAPLDLANGLRAYADPGGELRMGGRSFPAADLEYLDTDAATTSYGMVFFDDGRPYLLAGDGRPSSLWDGPVEDPKGWHPTAKADAVSGEVAFAVRDGDRVTLVVSDLAEGGRSTLTLDCGDEAGCEGLVVDGIDSGSVFVRTSQGTFRWGHGDREEALEPFAGTATRVADVRNRTVLFAGPRPTAALEGWTYVEGEIDAALTFDGRNVLSWSPVLEPVSRGGRTIRLDLPKDAGFFTFDTDGSVLAATYGSEARFFDCELPAGTCEEIGRLRMTGGDPLFVGNDM